MVGRCFGVYILFSKTVFFRLFFIEVRPCWTPSLNFWACVRLQGAITIFVAFCSMYDCLYHLLISKVYSVFFRWSLPDYVRFFPRRISFVRQCLIGDYSSPTIRDGSASSNDASRKPVSPRMQEKPIKITWRIRELSFSPNTALFLIYFILL